MKNKRIFGIVIVIIALVALVALWPQVERNNFENHYLSIMRDLNSTKRKAEVTGWFERDYNFTELYEWVHEKLEFIPVNETFERNTAPSKILESGKGRCEEFSILYVAALLAHGYHSRVVVSVNIGNPWFLNGQHVWAEVKLDSWVHVDPSDKVWNEPYRYEKWAWGGDIGSNVRIYAFEEGKYEDVTLNYKHVV